ncbi:MAG: oligosaccharide flippase family protein [Bacilli bacterium]|nr:oligosaccharide flippase family protein [Bacilli bacterium]
MRKSKFIKSTIILLIGGFLTKILGMFIKIITTRLIGTKAIGLYMMIMPTFNLFITLAQAGFPISISKIVSEDKKENKKIVFSSIFMSVVITFILMIILILTSPIIAKFLHNDNLRFPIMSIGFTLPFISLSGIIRGYFFGKEKMLPHVISNTFEQIVRIILNIIFLPILSSFKVEVIITFLILSNVISETMSIIVLYFFLPKKIKITKDMIKPDHQIMKDVLNISLPTTGSRLIGTIGYFFEPIILTTFLLLNGYTSDYITFEYGIITGYVMPLLMLPSFFSMAISQAVIPVISNGYANGKIKYIKSKIKQSLTLSFIIGLVFTILIMIFPEFFMNFIYNTNEGVDYIRIIAPFFLFYYVQVPLTSVLQSLNKAKEAMMSTLVGIFIKIGLIIILSFLKIGLYPLIIATIVNMIYVTIFNYIKIKKVFK